MFKSFLTTWKIFLQICSKVQRDPKATSIVARSSCGRCAQHLRRIRGCDAHPKWIRRMSRKCSAQISRTMCVMSPAYFMQMWRAPAARYKDVTFGTFCMSSFADVTSKVQNIDTGFEWVKLAERPLDILTDKCVSHHCQPITNNSTQRTIFRLFTHSHDLKATNTKV
jgi:hypothetical protein